MANALELSARHSEVVHSAIKHWVDSGILSESKATLLADSIAVQGFDWNKFAKYTLRLAVLCFVVAVSSTVFEKRFARFFKWLLAMPAWVRGTATGLMAVGVHIFAHQRSQQVPEQKWGNEAIHGVGALAFAGAAFQVLEQLNSSFRAVSSNEKDGPTSKVNQEERQRLERNAVQCVMLGLAAVYGAVGVISGSNFIWSCSMMVLGYCCGGMTGYMSGTYWIDMDSPLLFTAFGSALIGVARLMRSQAATAALWSTTRTWGMLYLFISLWIMSIWGYDDYFEDYAARSRYIGQAGRMFLWSLVFLAAAGGSIWHGLRYDDSTTKGFGLTFLGINLYTKFFECCWGWAKPLFFMVLAGTFAIVGRYAEDVWNMRVGVVY